LTVTAWNNGKHHEHGAGYGFKLDASDRDRYIKGTWKTVVVELPDGVQVEANIDKASFWSNTCREIINKDFGRWLRGNGYAPWPIGNPPKFRLTPQHSNHFKLSGT
jgi:hypothetical protein